MAMRYPAASQIRFIIDEVGKAAILVDLSVYSSISSRDRQLIRYAGLNRLGL